MSDEYAEWRRLLSLPRIDGYMDEPMAGFWRVRFGAKNEWTPFATFWRDGELVGLRLGQIVSPHEHWTRYAYNPISESVYRAVAERGEPWPRNPKEEHPNEQCNANRKSAPLHPHVNRIRLRDGSPGV